MKTRTRTFAAAAAGLLALAGLAAPASAAAAPTVASVQTATSTPTPAQTALSRLATLKTDYYPYMGTYDRTGQFGRAWIDTDKNGCDTRNDMLKRDLTNDVFASDGCTVLSGRLADKYTGKIIYFQRGTTTSSKVQIDHIVPLRLAIARGADKWTQETRIKFANDPRNLLSVDGPTNSAKGAQGPDLWMPPNTSYHCSYAIKYTNVMWYYSLQVTRSERAALQKTLSSC